MLAIEVSNLTKKFRVKIPREKSRFSKISDVFFPRYIEKIAVDDISFQIELGEFIGYIGPNGAGKSTTVKILTGVLTPSSGSVYVMDRIPIKSRKQNAQDIGVVFGQRSQLLWDLPVVDSFELHKRIYDVSDSDYKIRMEKLSRVLGIDEYMSIPVRKLSLGQRMRCEIAVILLHHPKILFLDEPTIGLDVVVKQQLRDFLRQINRQEGVTIILTTHDMSDVERLCKRLIMINQGKIILDDDINKVRSQLDHQRVLDFELERIYPVEEIEQLVHQSTDSQYLTLLKLDSTRFSISLDTRYVTAPKIINYFMGHMRLKDVHIQQPDIETIVRHIYKEEEKC